MGGKLKDFGIAFDLSDGVLGVRLYVGHGIRGVHRPSRPLSRPDVRRVHQWLAGDAALPDHVDAWFASLDEMTERPQIEEALRALSWVAWLALWWHASGEDGSDAPNAGQARGVTATPH